MIVHNVKQGSSEWLRARAGIVTASELHNLVTPKGKVRTGEGVDTYVYRKIAETWLTNQVESHRSFAMEQGSILEETARPWLALELGCPIDEAAFVTTDDRLCGASPDGMVRGSNIGVEIKCPEPTNHVRWVVEGVVPPEHLLQCLGGMYVTGADEWVFCSYRRLFPNLVVRVPRDPMMMDVIRGAVEAASERIKAGVALLHAAYATATVPDETHDF